MPRRMGAASIRLQAYRCRTHTPRATGERRRPGPGRITRPTGTGRDRRPAATGARPRQAPGTIPDALSALRPLVKPGGVLFGAEIWDQTPTDEQLAHMRAGMSLADCLYLPDLVEAAVAAGFRPLRVETATPSEWDEFESGYAAGPEAWLLANGDHPEAAEVRARLDAHRSTWLRGHRGVLGFAYLTLASRTPDVGHRVLAINSRHGQRGQAAAAEKGAGQAACPHGGRPAGIRAGSAAAGAGV